MNLRWHRKRGDGGWGVVKHGRDLFKRPDIPLSKKTTTGAINVAVIDTSSTIIKYVNT